MTREQACKYIENLSYEEKISLSILLDSLLASRNTHIPDAPHSPQNSMLTISAEPLTQPQHPAPTPSPQHEN